jgi:hypothetical protein
MDIVFGVGSAFALAALVLVVAFVRMPRPAPVVALEAPTEESTLPEAS